MPRHTQKLIDELHVELDRARIRDSREIGGLRLAATFALFASDVLHNPHVEEEHRKWIEGKLNELRSWLIDDWNALGSPPDGVHRYGVGMPRDQAWEQIAYALDPERVEERA